MDSAIEKSLSDKPYVKGFLCADSNGLLLCGMLEFLPMNVVHICFS